MNILHYLAGKELKKNAKNLNPRVDTTKEYTFGDVINFWCKGEKADNYRMFMRDDHYFKHENIFILMDFRSHDIRHIRQITMFEDDAPFQTEEVFCPTLEDVLDHVWYEYKPMYVSDYFDV